MSSDNIDNKRKILLGKRLIEQAKVYNRQLGLQIISIVFLFCIIIPGIFCVILLLLNSLIGINTTDPLYQFKTSIFNFFMTNPVFHLSIIISLLAFIIVLIAYYLFRSIKFNDKEIELASYVLFTIKKNDILSYKNLKKEISFRNLSFQFIDKVVSNLMNLKHVHLENNEIPELKVIIRDSDW